VHPHAAPPAPVPAPVRANERAIQAAVGDVPKVAAESDGAGGWIFTVKCTQHWTDQTNTVRWSASGPDQTTVAKAWVDHDKANPHGPPVVPV
jgi:hypothetical protein